MLFLKGHRSRCRGLAFSPDGVTLASVAGNGHAVSLWNLTTGKRRFLSGRQVPVRSMAFSPNGQFVAAGRVYGSVSLWNAATGEAQLVSPGGNTCSSLVFTPDGKKLLVGRDHWTNYLVQHWHLHGSRNGATYHGTHWNLKCLAVSADGRTLAAGSAHHHIRLWNLATNKHCRDIQFDKAVYALAFSPDGQTLAVATGQTVCLWDLVENKERLTLTGHRKLVSSVAFSTEGQIVLSASHDGTVRLWDPQSGRESRAFDWQIGQVYATAFSQDGMRAAAGGDADLVVWDMDD